MDDERLPSVERSVWLPAPPPVVWRHITAGELVSDWFGGAVELAPRVGGDIRFDPGDGVARWGTVEDVVADTRIQWSWRRDDGEPSEVSIVLEPEAAGTRMTVTERLIPYEMRTYPLIVDPSESPPRRRR